MFRPYLVVLGGMKGKCAPSATNVEETLAFLELNFVANDVELLVLHVVEGVFGGKANTGGVNHGVAEEGVVEVV